MKRRSILCYATASELIKLWDMAYKGKRKSNEDLGLKGLGFRDV